MASSSPASTIVTTGFLVLALTAIAALTLGSQGSYCAGAQFGPSTMESCTLTNADAMLATGLVGSGIGSALVIWGLVARNPAASASSRELKDSP